MKRGEEIPLLTELLNPDNWKPDLTKIAKKLQKPVSTVYDDVKLFIPRLEFSMRLLTEIETEEARR